MAQAVVQSSTRKLRSAIGDEAIMRLNFTGDLQEMLLLLLAIDASIPNAEWMVTAGGDWLKEVRDAACWVCHMVDELQEMAVQKMTKMLDCPAAVESKRAVNKMKEIKEKLKELRNDSVRFDDAADRRALLQAPPAIVGRDADVRKILDRLSMCPSSQGPIILLIYGKPGIGRATVATMVFDDDKFKSYYRVWINIINPRSFDLHQIGKCVISQLVSAGEEEMSDHGSDEEIKSTRNRLHELLNGKKVLIVLHNILGDASKWKGLKDMFSIRGINSTQVIIIAAVHTSQRTMATEIVGVEGYHLEPLTEQMCCEIIKQAALRSQDTYAEEEDLELIATEVAKLCGGIPMAAKIFGSLLQFQQYREWPELLDFKASSGRDTAVIANTQGRSQAGSSPPAAFEHCSTLAIETATVTKEIGPHTPGPGPRDLGPVSTTADTAVKTSLAFSYRSMPPSLRLCFSYCAFVFATQSNIVKEDLIQQWIVLDLIEPSEAFSTSQLAEQYIQRLLDMSLLQTANSAPTSAADHTCAISFTMHADVVYFEQVHKHGFSLLEEGAAPPHCSYAAVANFDLKEELKKIFPDQNLKALRCLGCSRMELRDDSFSFATSLRVLELHKSSIPKLPESICELRHLGYLKLSGWSGLEKLPKSIGDLKNLLRIDLSSCSELVELPVSFGNLINLVHIGLSGCCKLKNLPESFGKLSKLVHIDLSGSSALENLPDFFGKLINVVHMNLSSCHALVSLPGSFGKLTKLEHINLSGCPELVNLPDSFGKLTNLVHINLSGCPGLGSLPGSFGKLTNLVDINLSGCSGLEELPQSFGKLIGLLHINLSGCSGLANLPGSFGDLQNLVHIDLSRCYGLLKLPESFANLKKLVHLDLSSWSCFEGIQRALGGLTNLQHLNLSQPCCYRADYHHLKGLKDVLSQFIRLKHLNLSTFLNPIFCDQSEEQNLKYIDFISGFSRLEYLDLSHSIFLRDLPESITSLYRLHTLDLSGCIRLKKMGQEGKVGEWMASECGPLRSVLLSNLESYQFKVGPNNIINNYSQLADVRCKELEITCLDVIESAEQAQSIKLSEKKDLQKLTLCWKVGCGRSVQDNAFLEELVPPHSVRYLELHGYIGTSLPTWLTPGGISSYNLVEVTMEDIPTCSELPPLGLLPNLQRVVLRRMASITRINAGELSGGNGAAFLRLSNFTIDDMGVLEEFTTTYCSNGEVLLFTVIDELAVHKCPNMSFVPVPARAQRLVISECNDLIDCCKNRGGRHGVEGSSRITSPVTEVTDQVLVVENCSVHLGNWSLLNHLPGLCALTIKNCSNLLYSPESDGDHSEVGSAMYLSSLQRLSLSGCHSLTRLPKRLGGLSSLRELQIKSCSQFQYLPDSMKLLTSLRSLHFSDCEKIAELPPCLGRLYSLQHLVIERCIHISRLPESIVELTNLKDLHILDCPSLKEWCGKEENKEILGHIRPKFEETATSDQLRKTEEDDSEQSDWTNGPMCASTD